MLYTVLDKSLTAENMLCLLKVKQDLEIPEVYITIKTIKSVPYPRGTKSETLWISNSTRHGF